MLGDSQGIDRMKRKSEYIGRTRAAGVDRDSGGGAARAGAPADRPATGAQALRSRGFDAGPRPRVTWQGFVEWMAARNL
jgi:hypothetical protein